MDVSQRQTFFGGECVGQLPENELIEKGMVWRPKLSLKVWYYKAGFIPHEHVLCIPELLLSILHLVDLC